MECFKNEVEDYSHKGRMSSMDERECGVILNTWFELLKDAQCVQESGIVIIC